MRHSFSENVLTIFRPTRKQKTKVSCQCPVFGATIVALARIYILHLGPILPKKVQHFCPDLISHTALLICAISSPLWAPEYLQRVISLESKRGARPSPGCICNTSSTDGESHDLCKVCNAVWTRGQTETLWTMDNKAFNGLFHRLPLHHSSPVYHQNQALFSCPKREVHICFNLINSHHIPLTRDAGKLKNKSFLNLLLWMKLLQTCIDCATRSRCFIYK